MMIVTALIAWSAASCFGSGNERTEKKDVVSKLLNIQVEMWLKGNKDEEAVFKLLKLDETNDNVLNSPVFSQWVDFVEKRSNSQEEAYDMMLDRLSSDFKSKNALVGALGGGKVLIRKQLPMHYYTSSTRSG
ncbi:unnamed protein product [Peronospora farinosa]|uniref:RxLR effector PexRD54 WY domain-containing protein n=1 Tax=Peronospora farinosa TaxID=134698 RepID=A0AAV0T680_9STRA|nr:unnamed protein product [Peronospora farinosa]